MNVKPYLCITGAACVIVAFGQTSYNGPRANATGTPAIMQSLSTMRVPSVVTRSTMLRHTDPTKVLHVTVGIPYANTAAIQAYADSVSDPTSINYGKFLTPAEVGQRFGAPQTTVDSVTNYLKSQGFQVTLVNPARITISATCTVGQAEKAFATTINDYQVKNSSEPGRASFFSFATTPKMPSTLATSVIDINGLQNFTKPRATQTTMTPGQCRTLYGLGTIFANNFRGQGRSVAISNWDGFRKADAVTFITHFGVPQPAGGAGSNIHIVSINGRNGETVTADGECDLDIQMAIGQAPLSNLYVYDNAGDGDLIGVLLREQTDNIADVISESWGWNIDPSTASQAHAIHLAMTAQGQTYMAASGDFGTSLEPFSYPNYDGEVLMVGGTNATTDTPGNRVSETAWAFGGGGWVNAPVSFNIKPTWLKGNGVPNINRRLSPDVAGAADFGCYFFYTSAKLTSDSGGTSFACPVFAGQLTTAMQFAISQGKIPLVNGKRRLGRVQDIFYRQIGKAGFYDVAIGNNGSLPDGSSSNAHPGWDFCTGLGAVNWAALNLAPVIDLPMPVTFLNVAEGTQVVSLTNSPLNVGALDGKFFSLKPQTVVGLGQVASSTYVFTLPANVARSQVQALNFSVSSRFANAATGQIYMFNYTTGKWDILKSAPLASSLNTYTASMKTLFTTYMSAAGQYRILVRALLPSSIGVTGNNYDMDLITSDVMYAPN